MGKQLGLYSSGSSIFGYYKDFSLCAFDGPNKKELLIKLQKPMDSKIQESLKRKYKIAKISYNHEDSILRMEFSEILKPYSYKKIIELTDEIIEICNKENILSITKCDSCDNQETDFYRYNEIPLTLCSQCFEQRSSELNQDFVDYSNAENRYMQGILGAILFAIPGIIVQTLLFLFLKRLGAISSLIYCSLALLGFMKFKGKTTPISAIWIILVSIFMTTIGTCISYSTLILYQIQDFQRLLEILAMKEVQLELAANILIQLAVSACYFVLEFFSLRKKWTFKTIKAAKKLT